MSLKNDDFKIHIFYEILATIIRVKSKNSNFCFTILWSDKGEKMKILVVITFKKIIQLLI